MMRGPDPRRADAIEAAALQVCGAWDTLKAESDAGIPEAKFAMDHLEEVAPHLHEALDAMEELVEYDDSEDT